MTHRKRRKRDTAEAMAPPAPVGRLFRAFRNNVKGEKEVTYNAGDVVISFTSKIGSFVLKIK